MGRYTNRRAGSVQASLGGDAAIPPGQTPCGEWACGNVAIESSHRRGRSDPPLPGSYESCRLTSSPRPKTMPIRCDRRPFQLPARVGRDTQGKLGRPDGPIRVLTLRLFGSSHSGNGSEPVSGSCTRAIGRASIVPMRAGGDAAGGRDEHLVEDGALGVRLHGFPHRDSPLVGGGDAPLR